MRDTNTIRDALMIYGYAVLITSYFGGLLIILISAYLNGWVVTVDFNHYGEGPLEWVLIGVLGPIPALYFSIITLKYVGRGNYYEETKKDDM